MVILSALVKYWGSRYNYELGICVMPSVLSLLDKLFSSETLRKKFFETIQQPA